MAHAAAGQGNSDGKGVSAVSNVQHEWRGQEADFAFLSKALPYDCYFTAIDQGRAANWKVGAMRKKRGLRAGLPDWLIVWRGTTLWIERKIRVAASDLKTLQEATGECLVRNGHLWSRANCTEDVELACRAAGIPLRATLGDIRTRIAEQNERLPAKPKRAASMKAGPRYSASAGVVRRAASKGVLV